MNTPRLRRADAVLLIVDVQERLLPAMRHPERVERGCVLLARTFTTLALPVLATEQNPTRLGSTVNKVAEALEGNTEFAPVAKMRFSALVPPIVDALTAAQRQRVVLCGLEAHVCVLQTALDLREAGYEVFLARDAVSSRFEDDAQAAFARMAAAGVVMGSAEMLVFELLESADAPEFKPLLPYVK